MNEPENPLLTYAHGKNLATQGKRLVAALQKLKGDIGPNEGGDEKIAQTLRKQIDTTESNLTAALRSFDTVLTKLRTKTVL